METKLEIKGQEYFNGKTIFLQFNSAGVVLETLTFQINPTLRLPPGPSPELMFKFKLWN